MQLTDFFNRPNLVRTALRLGLADPEALGGKLRRPEDACRGRGINGFLAPELACNQRCSWL